MTINKELNADKIVSRFVEYIKFDTQSNPLSSTTPSSENQLLFAQKLAKELISLGLEEVEIDKHGYLTATLAANTYKNVPIIGFIAHLDTSPDYTAKNVNPQFIKNYNGNKIVLNRQLNIVMLPENFTELYEYIGQTLITTDGTTLLGADNKAGIAEIISALEFLLKNPQIEHGKVRIAFTPDEEIGKSADKFDVEKFGVNFAYTVDGGELGELQYENFNAATANIEIRGLNVHPGSAKNKMINAAEIAIELHNLLPHHEKPQFTEKYEGFFHLLNFEGKVEKATLSYIIRDHEREEFIHKKRLLYKACDYINLKYKQQLVNIQINDQYFNMREKIENVFEIIELAKLAFLNEGIEPKIVPVRGGTDGARLSYMGLPTPNIFTGGHNFHGNFEFIPVESMEKATRVIIQIIKQLAASY